MFNAEVDAAREALLDMTKPGVVTDHELSAGAGQRITEARYALFAKQGKVYPVVYPPPPAGDGRDVFKAADEGGEGLCTRKEIAKYLMRNQTLRHRLREGWAKFNSNFGTEDIAENHEELNAAQFVALWQEAAALRAAAEARATSPPHRGRRLSRACSTQARLLQSAPGMLVGTQVRLTEEAEVVEEDYDWGLDPIRPGEVGKVVADEQGRWVIEDEEDGLQVFVFGARSGKSDWYSVSDMRIVQLPAVGNGVAPPPAAAAPAAPAVDIPGTFRRVDRGGKGYLSREDFDAAFSIVRDVDELDLDTIGDLFMAADADNDRKVSAAEWASFAAAFPNFVAAAAAGSAAPIDAARRRGGGGSTNGHTKPVPAVDSVRAELLAMTKPGVVTDLDLAAAAAQRITEQRYRHHAGSGQVYPTIYPPPPAGDGTDVFKAADEAGEGLCTRKEIAKYLMRNQTLRHRLREGWAKFNANFGTEDIAENHEELTMAQFSALWQEAAKLRTAP